MNFNVRNVDLSKLNSATKYPSILTYHVIGAKGILQDDVLTYFPAATTLIGTEKIDGTNARMIFMP